MTTSAIGWFELAPVFRQRPVTQQIIDTCNASMVLDGNRDFTPAIYAAHALVELRGYEVLHALFMVEGAGATMTTATPGAELDELAREALTAFGLGINASPGTYGDLAENGHTIEEIKVGDEVVAYVYRAEAEIFPHVFARTV